MKTFLLTATYLVGIGELTLAVFFWVTHSKSEIRKVMALLAFSTGMWVIFSAFGAYANNSETILLTIDLVYVFGVFILTSLVHLVLIFPYPLFVIDRFHKLLLYVPAIIFSLISVTTNTLVKEFIVDPSIPGKVIGGPIHLIYNAYLLVLFCFSLYYLVHRARKTDGISKRNIVIFFWAILVGGCIPVFLDLVIPIFFSHAYEKFNFLFGNLATVLWLGGTTYIVLKK